MQSIAAFTFKYDQFEDRILLIGNLENQNPRIDFWLTRKLVMRLLGGTQELIEKTAGVVQNAPEQHKTQLAQFHHDHALQNLDVERLDQAVTAQDARLLTRIDISFNNEQYRLLFFSGGEEAIAVSVLTYNELHQILYLLHKGALELEWGVASRLFASELSSNTLQ